MDQKDLEQQEKDKAAFDTVFREAVAAATPRPADEDYTVYITPLANQLRTMFGEYEVDRREQEDKWLQDIRQWRGEYDPETNKRFHPKRSKAFLSITKTKVNAVTARETDLLFPANGEKNWGIENTPVPEMNPQLIQDLVNQYAQQTGTVPDEAFIKEQINIEAKKRADAMQVEMHDQLTELKYRYTIRQVIRDGNLYGTGVLKGPLVKRQIVKRWLPQGDKWVTVSMERYSPWCEHVSVWDFYPDMSSRTMANSRGVFQRHVMSRHKVWELAKRADFKAAAIKSYLKQVKEGDATYKTWEQDLQTLNRAGSAGTGYKETTSAGTSTIGGTGPAQRRQKYEVLEYWGYINSDALTELGIEIDEDKIGIEVAMNVWILGPMVIKAVLSDIDGVEIPYHVYYYEKDDTSIFGEGIPSIMRDVQKLFNASVRAMLDNAAIAAGPIVEANTDLLDPSEDPRDIYPFRVFLRDGMGAEAQAQAVHVYNVSSYTGEYMSMINFFMNAADDITTIPRFMYGESSQAQGAGKTATGLSMLMGAANVTLKEQIKNFDDGITKPFIKALYHWNMEFNPKEYVKGDFNIVATGSSSLVAREVRMESLMQFLNYTNNPTDLMYTNRGSVLKEMAKAMDLGELQLIKDANTIKMEEQSRAEQMSEERQFAMSLAAMKAQSGGHVAPKAPNQEQGNEGGMRPTMETVSPAELEGGKVPEVNSAEGQII